MRLSLLVAAVAALLVLGPPAPLPAAPATELDEVTYVAAGQELEVMVALAPQTAEQIGAAAAGAADRARAWVAGKRLPRPPLWGEPEAGRPPPGWPGVAPAGGVRLRAPLIGSRADRTCRGCTAVVDAGLARVAALYVATKFRVGAELATLSHLRLAMRANDGAVVWINGREVARRRIARGAGPLDPAGRPSGPEWESFVLPLAGLVVGDNLLTVEVRPATSVGAPVLDLSLVGATGVHVVRGPLLQQMTGVGATIAFDTDVPVRAAIEVIVAGASRTIDSAGRALAVHHAVEIDGLMPGQAVRYRVVVNGAAGPEYRFNTAPADGEVVRFVVYGDMRGGHATHGRIVEAVLAEAPDFVLVTGDLVLRGTDEADWQRFFSVVLPLAARVPYYPVAGNHDLGLTGDEERRIGDLFILPGVAERPSWASWYSFDVAGVHVIALDSNAYERPEQEAWLRRDLAAARVAGARAIVAAVHDGPYSRGIHGGNRVAAARYAPILIEAGVALLFAGHDHIYMRGKKDGLAYFVSGGGGAPLYPIRCGVRGRPRCKVDDGAELALSEHHYLVATVDDRAIEVCARRPDRTALERCVRYRLGRRGSSGVSGRRR